MDITEQYNESARTGRMLVGIMTATAAAVLGGLSSLAYHIIF